MCVTQNQTLKQECVHHHAFIVWHPNWLKNGSSIIHEWIHLFCSHFHTTEYHIFGLKQFIWIHYWAEARLMCRTFSHLFENKFWFACAVHTYHTISLRIASHPALVPHFNVIDVVRHGCLFSFAHSIIIKSYSSFVMKSLLCKFSSSASRFHLDGIGFESQCDAKCCSQVVAKIETV